jgi:hypothetical protein
MQLNLAFLDQPDPPSSRSSTARSAWDQLDEASRMAALEILARLIARILTTLPVTEASDE